MKILTGCFLVLILSGCAMSRISQPEYTAGKTYEQTRIICSKGNVSFLGTLLPFMGKVDSVSIIQTPGANTKVKSAKISGDGSCGAEFVHETDVGVE